MKSKEFIWGMIINAIVIIAITGGLLYLITQLTEQLTKVIVAIISLFATILVAIISNYLAKQNQLEFELQKEKISNYTCLVKQLCDFIRNPSDYNDLLATINLNSWVYGSPTVIQTTRSFMKSVHNEETKEDENIANLKKLLLAIRSDIGKTDFHPEDDLLKGLLPPKKIGKM